MSVCLFLRMKETKNAWCDRVCVCACVLLACMCFSFLDGLQNGPEEVQDGGGAWLCVTMGREGESDLPRQGNT